LQPGLALGDRDQEDLGLKLALANISGSPYFEKPFTKTGLVLE
jgi:hypothetical protein